jgi:putative oxidoreductase
VSNLPDLTCWHRMTPFARRLLIASGLVAVAGALLHLAIPLLGPDAYALLRAPPGLVQLARDGHPRAAISCVVIAALLALFAAYAFSAAGWIRRLPLLRTGLALIAAVLLLRGLLFVPLLLLRPDALARICDCRGIDAFIVLTSLLCLAMGAGYALGAIGAGRGR